MELGQSMECDMKRRAGKEFFPAGINNAFSADVTGEKQGHLGVDVQSLPCIRARCF